MLNHGGCRRGAGDVSVACPRGTMKRHHQTNTMKPIPVTTFQLAVLDGPHFQADEYDNIVSIEWLSVKQISDYLFEFYQGDVLTSSVDLDNPLFDLSSLLGILVVGDTDRFEAIVAAWKSKLPSLSIAFKRLAEGSPDTILRASLDCLAENLVSARRHGGQAALDLAVYRREFDRLQSAFSRLEEYVGQQSFQSTTEVFEYPPDSAIGGGGAVSQSGNGRARILGALVQYLPVDSLGVSGLSIHIHAKPDPPVEPLRIRLRAVETGQIFGVWNIDPVEVSGGWVELALTHAVSEPALSLEVIIEWPAETSGWSLSLGPLHPHKEFAARTDAGETLGSPVALRIYKGLPGVRVPATTTAIRPMNAPPVLTELVPRDIYSTVEQILPDPNSVAPPLVSYDSNIKCITVHPHRGGLMTVARMNVAVPKRAWRVSAQIHLAHEQANCTQFGLMICASTESSSALDNLKQLDAAAPAFSGWKSLAPLDSKRIGALIEPSDEECFSLYLLTRQAPDSSPDFAWARFDRFEFNILPASPAEETTATKSGSSYRESGSSTAR
jgi:hypothetical protein